MFCTHVPLLPAAPLEMNLNDFVKSVEEAMHCQLRASTNIYVATDGGSKDDVGAFGVVVTDLSFASGDGSEDQSPFKQELSAILYAAKGMTQAARVEYAFRVQTSPESAGRAFDTFAVSAFAGSSVHRLPISHIRHKHIRQHQLG